MKWLIFHIGNWSIKAAIILTLFKSWNAGAYAIWWSLNFYRIYEPGSEAREYILHWQDRLFCHFGKFPPSFLFWFLFFLFLSFLPSTMGENPLDWLCNQVRYYIGKFTRPHALGVLYCWRCHSWLSSGSTPSFCSDLMLPPIGFTLVLGKVLNTIHFLQCSNAPGWHRMW
jgi:hypothetical protein